MFQAHTKTEGKAKAEELQTEVEAEAGTEA